MKVTLANLDTATAQDVFDQVARHLLTQKKQCRDQRANKDSCLYRSHDGSLMCAAGCLMSDEEYKPEFEFHSWGVLFDQGEVPPYHLDLITGLQYIHDNSPVEDWYGQLEQFGIVYDLNLSALEEFS